MQRSWLERHSLLHSLNSQRRVLEDVIKIDDPRSLQFVTVAEQEPLAGRGPLPDLLDGALVDRELERVGVALAGLEVDDLPGAVFALVDRVDPALDGDALADVERER